MRLGALDAELTGPTLMRSLEAAQYIEVSEG
jgi:hypothetical protein